MRRKLGSKGLMGVRDSLLVVIQEWRNRKSGWKLEHDEGVIQGTIRIHS